MNFTIEADLKRRLIRSKIYGIWKKETATEYHEEFKKVVQPLLGDKWAKIVNLGNWKPSYPEMIDVIGDHIRWCHDNKAVFSIFVVDNPVTTNQLKKMIEKSGYADSCPIFQTLTEAENLLKQNGF
jgi:hypothetical protein